ncbi:MAG: hypothetical protein WCW02_01060 [Candidatus Buchananbacteria bacterium]
MEEYLHQIPIKYCDHGHANDFEADICQTCQEPLNYGHRVDITQLTNGQPVVVKKIIRFIADRPEIILS